MVGIYPLPHLKLVGPAPLKRDYLPDVSINGVGNANIVLIAIRIAAVDTTNRDGERLDYLIFWVFTLLVGAARITRDQSYDQGPRHEKGEKEGTSIRRVERRP